jgi:ketosteroid isomerase-like protein
VPATHQDIYERYLRATMTRNADAVSETFTPDGVLEAPLVPAGHAFPRRLEGRAEIRDAMAAYYRRSANDERKVNVEKTRYVLHATADPDTFIVEIDAVFDAAPDVAGESTTMSLVQIFRLRDGKIALLRDYFAPAEVD